MSDILQRLDDENEVKRVILTWMDGIDSRSYERLRSAWADEMEAEFHGFPDMGSGPITSGKHNSDVRCRNIITMISEFAMTQHLTANH